MQVDNVDFWKNRDKHLLNKVYSIKDIQNFLSSNFEILENNNEIYIDISK